MKLDPIVDMPEVNSSPEATFILPGPFDTLMLKALAVGDRSAIGLSFFLS